MKPSKQSTELITEFSHTRLSSNEAELWWLVQHSFVLKLGDCVIYLDPFLSPMDSRRIPPLFNAEQSINADLITGSHDHGDHIDRPIWPSLAQASADALFLVPELLRDVLSEDLHIPSSRFRGLDDGESIDCRGIQITAIAAAHEFLDRDPETGQHPYLGFVFKAGDISIYFAGDTCIYEGLVAKLQSHDIDLTLLPINGRDANRLRRGIVGNMTYQEAADLAGAIGAVQVVPAHYTCSRATWPTSKHSVTTSQ